MTTRESAQNSGDAGEGGELFMNMALGYQIPFKLIPSIKASLTKALITGSKAWLEREQTSPSSTNVNFIVVRGAQLWGPQSNHRGGSTTTGTHMRQGGRRGRGFTADRHWRERQILIPWCSKDEWRLPQRRGREKEGRRVLSTSGGNPLAAEISWAKSFANPNPKKWIKAKNGRINGVRGNWQTKQMEDRLLHYSSFVRN